MSDDLATYRLGAVGDDARDFLDSELGKRIVEIADSEISEMTCQLIDAVDATEISRLQTEIKRRQYAIQWFVQVYEEGQQALQFLESKHDD